MRAMTDPDGIKTEVAVPQTRWRKAKTPALATSASAEEALTGIVVSGVQHLRGNEACVLARAHEEGIHQMRVAGRRLRSALILYRDHLPDEQFRYLNGELKWLIRELGSARDWDVFVDGVLRPVEGDLTEEPTLPVLARTVEEMRDEAYDRAAAAIKSQRYAGLILLLKAWAEGRRWHDGASKEQAAAMRTPAVELARQLLDQGYEETLALAGNFAERSAEERHSVRIRIKKLRYATEFFGALFPRRQVAPHLTAMKALQDQLGLNNDVEVARGLLKKAPKRARGKERRDIAYAAGLVIGWHTHVSDHREQGALRAWDRFVGKHPFWRPGEATPPVAAASGPPGEAD
jgi:triphosphatase